ncbi:MAG: CheR family methyltransferase [Xenococcaceae cyanobacterium MO_188.B29]|nr:CheR family methyltransferase [Xenococcaceae cyanobacterium MO_188.B29]
MTANNENQQFGNLLEYIKQSRGFDFTGYKPSSLKRRINKQMQSHQIESFGDYLDFLQVHPEEFLPLFNTILINVTSFFRDTHAWNYLKNELLPRMIEDKSETETIRVWSAGCASGEEAYSLAIALHEALGSEQFRQRVKIYATDVDEEALAQARHANYSEKDLKPLSSIQREQYFESLVEKKYAFRPDLRRAVIFGRHDLVQDAPISRLDLLVCRNTLMYFNAETQGRILNRFHFALNDTGVLFLGKAEMLLTHSDLFTPINLQYRFFTKVIRINGRDRLLAMSSTNAEEMGSRLSRSLRLRELAFDSIPVGQLIIDKNGELIMINKTAQSLFGLNLNDIGRPFQDLEISYRPLELRSRIEQVKQERRQLTVTDVAYHVREKETRYLDIQLTPLLERNNQLLGTSITITDVSRYHHLQTELQRANQELETANEELQSSNEELETTNEELQSTNEELETTNEELQSTNEELETMNEELQSTNEELQTINDELRLRSIELDQTNAFLGSILASIKAGVVVIDRQFNILSWNNEAENLWGMRGDEIQGQSFFGLDIGLPIQQLREPLRLCLAGEEISQEMVVSAINRRGQTIDCRLGFNPLLDSSKLPLGVIILMEEIRG